MPNLEPDIIQLQQNIALRRDEKSYRELFIYFYKPLTHFAEGFVKSPESAEEIYSDVFLKLWNLGENLNNVSNLKLYLYTSVKNNSLNYLAKYHKLPTQSLDNTDFSFFDIPDKYAENVIDKELYKLIGQAIHSLPPQGKLVYKLIKEEGFNYRETSAFLHISVNTVESHMKQALKKLRSAISNYLHADKN